MIFFKRKTYPESVDHPAVVNFLKGELRLNWNGAYSMIENWIEQGLKTTRIIKKGELIYRFKFVDVVRHLHRATGLPSKKIEKQLDAIVNCDK